MKRQSEPYYILAIQGELERRCRQNPRYSLRSFARALDIDVALLSRSLSGKKPFSVKTAEKIFTHLNLPIESFQEYMTSVKTQRRRLTTIRLNENANSGVEPQFEPISDEQFAAISDLYHYAILELAQTDDFESDPRKIAARLNISHIEAKLALERLIRLGLLADRNGRLVKTKSYIRVIGGAQTDAARRRHIAQVIQKAHAALNDIPVAQRHAHCITIPIDSRKIAEAKYMIEEFSAHLADFLSSGRKESVYELNVNLFPLTSIPEN